MMCVYLFIFIFLSFLQLRNNICIMFANIYNFQITLLHLFLKLHSALIVYFNLIYSSIIASVL